MSEQDEQNSVLDLLRDRPIFSPPPGPTTWCSDGEVPWRDHAEFFGGRIGFDAYLPPIPTILVPSPPNFSSCGIESDISVRCVSSPLMPPTPPPPPPPPPKISSGIDSHNSLSPLMPLPPPNPDVSFEGSQRQTNILRSLRNLKVLKISKCNLSESLPTGTYQMNKLVPFDAQAIDPSIHATLERKCRVTIEISSEYLQQHFGSRRGGAAKGLSVSISTLERIFRQIGMPFSFRKKNNGNRSIFELTFGTLPNAGGMGQLDFSEQSLVEFDDINNGAHAVTVDQSRLTVPCDSYSEKKKRKYRTKSVISLQDLQQHFGSSRADAAMALGVSISTVKRICRQHGIRQWPRTKKNNGTCSVLELDLVPESIAPPTGEEMAAQLGSLEQQSLVEFDATNSGTHIVGANSTILKEVSGEVLGPSMDENLDWRLQCLQIPQPARSPPEPIAPPTGEEMVQLCSSEQQSFVEFDATDSETHVVGVISTMMVVSVEDFGPSMDENLDLRLQCIQIPRPDRSSPRPIASPTGGEMVQLGSSEQQSSVGFDATNSGTHVVRKDQSTPTVSRSKKRSSISLEDLQQHFGHSRKDTADFFGFSVSTFKRIIHRDHGIDRWPYRRENNVNGSLFKPKLVNESVQAAEEPLSPTSSLPVTVGSDHHNSPREPLGEKHMSPTCKTPISTDGQAGIENEIGGHIQDHNGLLPPDIIESSNWSNAENDSKEERVKTPTSHDSCPGNNPAMNLSISSAYKESGEAAGGPSELAFQLKESPAWRQVMTPTPHIMRHLTATQDMSTVTFKATYREHTIKFWLSLTSGIADLKEQVAKRLELELGSFNVEYQDEDLEWVLIACDEDLQNCLTFFSSLGKKVIRLRVLEKISNSRNSRERCRGLKRKRSQV